jgi:hypothetical protein
LWARLPFAQASDLRGSCLDDERAFEIGCGLGADVLDSASPVRAEVVIAQAILLAVDDRLEPSPERRPLGWIDLDFEYRILNALSEITAGFSDPPQPSGAVPLARSHVVSHENEHHALSLPDPRRIGVEVAAQMARQELCLQIRNEPERRNFVEEGMTPLGSLSLLPSHENRLARGIGQEDGAAVLPHEIPDPDLPAVE